VLGAIELIADEVRAAREMYARAANLLTQWRRAAGWERLMVAELSDELGDSHRARREMVKVADFFDGKRCIIASRRLDALRQPAHHRALTSR
jgi:hypothetical protein